MYFVAIPNFNFEYSENPSNNGFNEIIVRITNNTKLSEFVIYFGPMETSKIFLGCFVFK